MIPLHHATVSVLLIDDDVDCRALARHAVESCGVELVVEAANGHEAMAFFKRALDFPSYSLPSLILLDLEMDGMDGIATLKQIRAIKELRDIPVVIVSGVGDGPLMARALDLGISGYYVKPNDTETLIQNIQSIAHTWLRKAERRRLRLQDQKTGPTLRRAG